MKKFLVSAIALSTMLWVGCGGDDDEDPPPVENTVTVTADTTAAPTTPLVYNDAVWNNVTATSITLSTGNPLPVSPVKTPLGPDKSLSAPSSVDFQAIKKDGRLYLRFQWTDASLSMQREQWTLTGLQGFNFTHQTHLGEDQVIALFEDDPDSAWDFWNWRVLTTGFLNKAEDGTMLDGEITWDGGLNQVAWVNATGDVNSPPYFPSNHGEFTGDILYKSDKISRAQATQYQDTWDSAQTIPGWYIEDEVDFATIGESRWDIDAVHNHDSGTNQYTVVMVRDLTTGEADDVAMANLDRIRMRVGIVDNDKEIATGDTKRKFSVDFWLALP